MSESQLPSTPTTQLFQQASIHGWNGESSLSPVTKLDGGMTGGAAAAVAWGDAASFEYDPKGNARKQQKQGGSAGNGGAQAAEGANRKVPADEFTSVGNTGKRWPRSNNTKKKKGSDIEQEISGQNLYKTELCCSFESSGSCRYGVKCQFAHGKSELRPVLRHPKYKTEICKTFSATGSCPYGKRCRFIHTPTTQHHMEGRRVPAGYGYQAPQGMYGMAGDGAARGNVALGRGAQWSVEWPQNSPSQAGPAGAHVPRGHPAGGAVPIGRAGSAPAFGEADAYGGFGGIPMGPGDAAMGTVYAHPVHPHMAVMGDETFRYNPRAIPAMSMGSHVPLGMPPHQAAQAQGFEQAPGMFGGGHMPQHMMRTHSAGDAAHMHAGQQRAAEAGRVHTDMATSADQLSSLFANSLSLTDSPTADDQGSDAPSLLPTQGSPDDTLDDNNRLSIFAKFSF